MTPVKRLFLILLAAMLVTAAGCVDSPAGNTFPTTEPSTLPSAEPSTAPTEPPLTADGLMGLVADAIHNRSLSQMSAELLLDFTLSMKSDGFRFSVDSSIELDMDALVCEDPIAMYLDMKVKAEAAGQKQVQKVQAYYLLEEDTLGCYAFDESTQIWTYANMGAAPEASDAPADETPTQRPADVVLDPGTKIVDQKETYVLHCTLTSEHLSGLLEPITGSGITPLSDSSQFLPDSLCAVTVLYIDVETLLPVRIQMDISGIDDFFNDMITDSSGIPSVELSMTSGLADDNESPMTIDINTLSITLSDLGFDPVQVPAPPQEAYDYLEMAAHDPDLGDGSYLLVRFGAAAKITPPSGWQVWSAGFDQLYMESQTLPCYAIYEMYSGMNRNQLVQMILSNNVIPMQESDYYDSHGYGSRIGKFDTLYAKTNYGVTMYYAWAPMDDGWLLLTVQDETGSDMEAILTPLVEAVEKHEPIY